MPHRITKVLGLLALTGLSGLMNAQTALDWKPAGPVYNAGRARNMIVDHADSKTLYVGSASSGIFKSKDGGVNWYAIDDQATIRNISYLAQAADGTIYAGTGEGFLRPGQKSKAQSGTGLYKLNLSDSTLVSVGSASSSIVGTVINRVACSPLSVNIIALATSNGIFISTNAGGSFALASLPGVVTGSAVSGQDVKFDTNGILYCSIGCELGTGTGTNTPASQIFKSSDASLSSFSLITPISTILPDMNYGRIELGISPSNPNVIYASCANKYVNVSSATLKGLFVSYDAGVNWGLILQGSSQLDPLSNGGTLASGDYAQVILVNPTNSDQIFFGSYSFYVFTRTSGSNANPIGNWQQLGESVIPNFQYYLHENIHDIKLIPGSPPKFYFITDAGVYRSIDLLNPSQTTPVSFQPFYKGMITGQFNSVSIERYPIGDSTSSTRSGTTIKPYSGFIGGTGGNGLTYFSGTFSLVTTELNYIGGEVYNSEYSKILPDAAFASAGNGGLYRSTNVKTSNPTLLNLNKYTNGLSKIAPTPNPFANANYNITGTPFRLWENYGQTTPLDSAVFYNDSTRYQASMTGLPDPITGVRELITKTTFTFSTSRPNQFALIDSVVVRTGTVVLPISAMTATLTNPPFNGPSDAMTIYAGLPHNYTVSPTTTTLSVVPVGQTTVPITFTLNATTLIDNISVTFTAPPFATKTITSYPSNATGTNITVADGAAYYRVFATVYYRYNPTDTVTSIDNNISTKTTTYSAAITQSLNWNYGSFSSYTVSATSTVAVSNPTYILTSNAALNPTVIHPATPTSTNNSPSFVVAPYGTTNYKIQEFGTFTLTAPIVYTVSIAPYQYTIAANTATTTTNTTYTLNPGSSVQSGTGIVVFTVTPTSPSGITYTILTPGTGTTTTSQTFTFAPTSFSINPVVNTATTSAPYVYIVSPTVTTTYTLSQTTGTLTQSTNSTISTSTYVLNPGSITQTDNPVFVVNTGTTAVTYTINGISSNTLAGASATTTYVFPLITTSVITLGAPAFAKNNKLVKMPTSYSARIAMIMNNSDNTGSADAIVVSKNPLALNDPLSVVRVSQSGVYADDATGLPTTTIITTMVGNPTFLEWSKKGTEIYFATNANKLYRVSHITAILDLSPSSYSGKFYTDVFKYASAPVNSATLNPASPYRTTLIGSFDKPITSISVSNDSKHLAVTFNSSSTGTTATIMYNGTTDASKSDASNIAWASAQGTLPSSVAITYCSLLEKRDNRILFLGTDNGMYYTPDVTTSSPNWSNVNNGSTSKLPNVQIFDIKQQTFESYECYNSGQIYVATNGRGVWTTGTYFIPYSVGIKEYQKPINGHNLSVYPNPTNGNVNIDFNSVEGETATIHIMDISGRVVQSQDLGKLNAGDVSYSLSTNELNSGVYIVNISSNSGVKRVTKLIVTK